MPLTENPENQSTKGFMKNDYNDSKADKSNELNESMSITAQSPDEYERKINNVGGNE